MSKEPGVKQFRFRFASFARKKQFQFSSKIMERLYMEAQDGLKTIAPPLFLNIFFYFLLV